MKAIILFTCFLCLAIDLINAVPDRYPNTGNSEEEAARGQITAWQRQYNRYVEASLANREETGCTSRSIVYRQEWYFRSSFACLDLFHFNCIVINQIEDILITRG